MSGNGPLPGTGLNGLVTAIDHVGIAVGDLDEAIRFHGENFGLELTHSEQNEE